jgi:hypothetical protein
LHDKDSPSYWNQESQKHTKADTFWCLRISPDFHSCTDTCPIHISINVSLKHFTLFL